MLHWGFVYIIHYLSYVHNSSDQNVLSPTWTGCIFLQKEDNNKIYWFIKLSILLLITLNHNNPPDLPHNAKRVDSLLINPFWYFTYNIVTSLQKRQTNMINENPVCLLYLLMVFKLHCPHELSFSTCLPSEIVGVLDWLFSYHDVKCETTMWATDQKSYS